MSELCASAERKDFEDDSSIVMKKESERSFYSVFFVSSNFPPFDSVKPIFCSISFPILFNSHEDIFFLRLSEFSRSRSKRGDHGILHRLNTLCCVYGAHHDLGADENIFFVEKVRAFDPNAR